MKSFFTILSFGLIVQCFGQNSEVELNQYFSKTEITDLNRMADFFQSELCGKIDRTKFSSCFLESLPETDEELFEYYVSGQISYRKQKKFYDTLNDSTFKKIWALCPSTLVISEPPYEYKSICFSGNENTIAFLKALGENNEYIKYYAKKLEKIGGFDSGTFLTQNILRQPEKWNLNDRNIQIFLSIHYLTQNDSAKRDKKAKRIEKRYHRNLIRNKTTTPNNTYN